VRDRQLRTPVLGWIAFSALVALAGAGALARAQAKPAEEATQYSSFNGRQTFRSFCVNCHGTEGLGDGYLATELKTRPTNLTRLAAKADGVFPADRVRASIDGTVAVAGHGMREMPVWGDVFIWPEKDTPERREIVKRKIGELVEYIRSIQEPAEKP
jgi:hypothetical protein